MSSSSNRTPTMRTPTITPRPSRSSLETGESGSARRRTLAELEARIKAHDSRPDPRTTNWRDTAGSENTPPREGNPAFMPAKPPTINMNQLLTTQLNPNEGTPTRPDSITLRENPGFTKEEFKAYMLGVMQSAYPSNPLRELASKKVKVISYMFEVTETEPKEHDPTYLEAKDMEALCVSMGWEHSIGEIPCRSATDGMRGIWLTNSMTGAVEGCTSADHVIFHFLAHGGDVPYPTSNMVGPHIIFGYDYHRYSNGMPIPDPAKDSRREHHLTYQTKFACDVSHSLKSLNTIESEVKISIFMDTCTSVNATKDFKHSMLAACGRGMATPSPTYYISTPGPDYGKVGVDYRGRPRRSAITFTQLIIRALTQAAETQEWLTLSSLHAKLIEYAWNEGLDAFPVNTEPLSLGQPSVAFLPVAAPGAKYKLKNANTTFQQLAIDRKGTEKSAVRMRQYLLNPTNKADVAQAIIELQTEMADKGRELLTKVFELMTVNETSSGELEFKVSYAVYHCMKTAPGLIMLGWASGVNPQKADERLIKLVRKNIGTTLPSLYNMPLMTQASTFMTVPQRPLPQRPRPAAPVNRENLNPRTRIDTLAGTGSTAGEGGPDPSTLDRESPSQPRRSGLRQISGELAEMYRNISGRKPSEN